MHIFVTSFAGLCHRSAAAGDTVNNVRAEPCCKCERHREHLLSHESRSYHRHRTKDFGESNFSHHAHLLDNISDHLISHMADIHKNLRRGLQDFVPLEL